MLYTGLTWQSRKENDLIETKAVQFSASPAFFYLTLVLPITYGQQLGYSKDWSYMDSKCLRLLTSLHCFVMCCSAVEGDLVDRMLESGALMIFQDGDVVRSYKCSVTLSLIRVPTSLYLPCFLP